MVTENEFNNLKGRVEKLEQKLNKLLHRPSIKIDKKSIVEINVEELLFIKRLKSVLDRCLALLNYISDKYPQHPGLTSNEIKEIFGEKFGLTTITRNNISMSLKNVTGVYVARNKIKDKTIKYVYKILPEGKKYISEKIDAFKNR